MKSSGYCSWEATTLVCNDHVSVTILLTFARICLRDNISRLIGTEPAVEGIVGIVEGAGDDTSEREWTDCGGLEDMMVEGRKAGCADDRSTGKVPAETCQHKLSYKSACDFQAN